MENDVTICVFTKMKSNDFATSSRAVITTQELGFLRESVAQKFEEGFFVIPVGKVFKEGLKLKMLK